MAVSYLTSSTLISSIKRRALIPSNQKTFQDADFLALANEEIDLGLVPSILTYHEEYFVYEGKVDIEANISSYAIPYRAIGGKFRDLAYEDAAGNLQKMTRIAPEERVNFQNGNGIEANAYYIKGNEVVLVPSVGATPSGKLVFLYYLRPNDLVDEDRVSTVSSIDTNTGIITVDNVPDNITVGSKIDFLQAKSGHKTRSFDITVTGADATGGTITVDVSDLPSDLVAGDHIASAGECMIPQIPSDLHSVLAQRVAARCLEALGDTQGLTNANTKLQEMELKTGSLIDNRSEGNPQKITNNNSLLRQRRRGW